MDDFLATAEETIVSRKKMTNPLYQIILAGDASLELLRNMVIHRFPIKNFWTRNILGIASRIDDYRLRRSLVENIYEEETGKLTDSDRHLNTFLAFGKCLGLTGDQVTRAPVAPETKAVIAHNLAVCNDPSHHFTEGVLSVLYLMEGQPAIVNQRQQSMETVMREAYRLPPEGFEYFTHHASSGADDRGVSELEDEHAETAIAILKKYCTSPRLRLNALNALNTAVELRHRHFTMIYENHHDRAATPFRFGGQAA
ncbi:MAG: TenA family transcriptional regulator [Betaproteobacteria bacterium]